MVPYRKDKDLQLNNRREGYGRLEITHFGFYYDLVIKSLKLSICLIMILSMHYDNKEIYVVNIIKIALRLKKKKDCIEVLLGTIQPMVLLKG